MQSQLITSYKNVVDNYNDTLKNDNLLICPEYWGGFQFIPYYFEFWDGHAARINKRSVFNKIDNHWEHSIIQP